MPNRRGRDRGGNNYRGNEHDDRVPLPKDGSRRLHRSNNTRRNKHNRQAGWDNKVRIMMVDDYDMTSNARVADQRLSNYQNNRRRDDRWKRLLPESPTYWYKVFIRSGQNYGKEYLLTLLSSFIKPLELVPYNYKVSREDASFAVGDYKVAVQLMNADRKITANDGWKLQIKVRPFTPMIEIDPKITTAMKRVMGTRYNAEVKALNLKKFHADPGFVGEGLFCPLNRPNIMLAALDIISEVIPDLQALDLTDNKISAIEHMKVMLEKCPQLKILHIGSNRIRDIKQLDALEGLHLEELLLDGNPLCDKYTDQETYIRAVRQRFPKVVKLDEQNLPPPILFDVEDSGHLPPTRPSFMSNEQGAETVKQFIQQYYQLYDDESSRQPLHQAYHEEAQFSMDAVSTPNDPGQNSMGCYIPESRNLMRVTNIDKRIRLCKRGKLGIVQALDSLPKTRHDPASFLVDLVLFTPQLIQLNVNGIFYETAKKNMRYFSRVFIIVPVGPGFTIMNDQLTIFQPTPEHIRKVSKQKAEAAVVNNAVAAQSLEVPPGVIPTLESPQAAVLPQVAALSPQVAALPQAVASSSLAPVPIAEPDIATKQQMVAALTAESGMNLLWSEKCLTETNWNYSNAMLAFTKLHKAGSIPAQAFIK